MDRCRDFFREAEGVTRALARLAATLHSLSRTLNRFDQPAIAGRAGRSVSRAVARVSAQTTKLQQRARALTADRTELAAWLRAHARADHTARFALESFRQIAASAIERHREFRDTLAASPAMRESFDSARVTLVERLDESIAPLRALVSWCNTVVPSS